MDDGYSRKQHKPLLTPGRFFYGAPNRFYVNGQTMGDGYTYSICDGHSVTEYVKGASSAVVYPAPKSIWTAKSSFMLTNQNGLLFHFFGGAKQFSALAKVDRVPVSFGNEETISGERSRVVKFFAQGVYGHVQALIGETTGRVYRLMYDSLPLTMMMGDPDPSKPPPKLPEPDTVDQRSADPKNWFSTTTITFTNIRVPSRIDAISFKPSLSSKMKVIHAKTESGRDLWKLPLPRQ